LRGVDLFRTNLREADLRGVDLREADLRGVDARGVDARGADLRYADLREADLRGVDARGVDLFRTNLRDADLRDVNLFGAKLRDADLFGANLFGEKLTTTPTQVIGYKYFIFIAGEKMKIGCELHSIDEWNNFKRRDIVKMDGDNAWLWWKEHKPLIMPIAKHHQKHRRVKATIKEINDEI